MTLVRVRFWGAGARFTLTVVRGELDRVVGLTVLARLRLWGDGARFTLTVLRLTVLRAELDRVVGLALTERAELLERALGGATLFT